MKRLCTILLFVASAAMGQQQLPPLAHFKGWQTVDELTAYDIVESLTMIIDELSTAQANIAQYSASIPEDELRTINTLLVKWTKDAQYYKVSLHHASSTQKAENFLSTYKKQEKIIKQKIDLLQQLIIEYQSLDDTLTSLIGKLSLNNQLFDQNGQIRDDVLIADIANLALDE